MDKIPQAVGLVEYRIDAGDCQRQPCLETSLP
jgi:hypothetical protein